MKSENSRMNGNATNSNAMNSNAMNSDTANSNATTSETMNSNATNSAAFNGNTASSEHAATASTVPTVSTATPVSESASSAPKPLYTTETTIGKVTYVVSVCQSPQASGTLKEKLRSIILQRAENARMREWQAKRELEMRERQKQL